jgi:cytochrome b561
MPDPDKKPERLNGSGARVIHLAPRTYSPMAQLFHWVTVGFVFTLIPVGMYMSYRGNELNVWDGLTNGLYSAHKLGGFLLLLIIIGRLIYRYQNPPPADEPTLEPWQRTASHLTHWSLYGLLILVPLMGWIGVSLYGARSIFGLFELPALWTVNQEASKTAFLLHDILGKVMGALIVIHIGAAAFHHFVRKDNVLRRMLPPPKKG